MSKIKMATKTINIPITKDKKASVSGTVKFDSGSVLFAEGCLSGWELSWQDVNTGLTFGKASIVVNNVKINGKNVDFTIEAGLQDVGGTYDWPYQGYVHILIIAETADN